MADRDYIDGLLSRIGIMYGEVVSDPLVEIWAAALGHLDNEDIRDALNRHVADPDQGRFFPKPADVMRNVSGTWGERSLMAWTMFERAFMRHGPYVPLIFEDKRIHAVVEDMGGMARFTNTDDREWPFIAKEFQTRYAGYRRPPEIEATPLLGAGNAFQSSQAPLRIGQDDESGKHWSLASPEKPRLELVKGAEDER